MNSTLAKEPEAGVRFIVMVSDRRLLPILLVEGISGGTNLQGQHAVLSATQGHFFSQLS